MEVLTAMLYILVVFALYKLVDYIIRLPWLGQLDTRHIFITGCDTGFGHALTQRLDSLGCHVFAGCYTEAGETALRKACSDRVHPLPLDVTRPESIRKAYATVKQILAGKELWAVVNNAGISSKNGPPDWLTLDDYKQTLDVNLYGLIDVCVTFLPLLKRSRGRIINMSSAMGRLALTNASPYAVSKFGVEAYSDCLRRAMQPFGVSVHILEPGFHGTNMVNKQILLKNLISAFDRAGPEIQQQYGPQYIDEHIIWLDNQMKSHCTEGVDDVVEAYVHALLARYPRARYVIGRDAWLLAVPISHSPEWLQDLIHHQQAVRPAIAKYKK